MAEICQKPITAALVKIWVRDLGDLPTELLCRALERLRKTWTSGFLPTPGNVRALIAEADASGLQLEAEDAWEKYLRHVKRFFHPDIGWNRRAPELSAIVELAARAAGGPGWVGGCPEQELPWVRKRFIEAYRRTNEVGQVGHLLTRGEAKKILARLAVDTQKAMKEIAIAPEGSGPAPDVKLRDLQRDFGEAHDKLGPPTPLPVAHGEITFLPHDRPPENFPGTAEHNAFKEWAHLFDRGETKLMWADYKAQQLSTVCA
jgi:hypothetical protein